MFLVGEDLLDATGVQLVVNPVLMRVASIEYVLLVVVHRVLGIRRGVQAAPESDGRFEVRFDPAGSYRAATGATGELEIDIFDVHNRSVRS